MSEIPLEEAEPALVGGSARVEPYGAEPRKSDGVRGLTDGWTPSWSGSPR